MATDQNDRSALEGWPVTDTVKSVANAVLGFFATKLITSILGILFVTLGVSYALILFYALNAGLPTFEVFDAVGDYMTAFFVICAIASFLLLMLVTLPGLLLMWDNWSISEENMGRHLYLSRLRWYVCVVPGTALFAVYMLIDGLLTENTQQSSWWWVPASIIVVAVLALVFFVVPALYKGVTPKWRDCREVVRAPWEALVYTNIMSFSYLMYFALIIESKISWTVDNELIRTFLAVLIGMLFLMFTTIWPYNLESAVRVTVVVGGGALGM